MPQRRNHRSSNVDSSFNRNLAKEPRRAPDTQRSRPRHEWNPSDRDRTAAPLHPNLTHLIEQDAPLQSHSALVLMYGPFQAEMLPTHGQGVASWIRDCVRKHGLPSLVRFDYRRRAQIFRRDQFQSWLEPLVSNG